MKHLITYIGLVLAVGLLANCSKNDDDTLPKPTEIRLTTYTVDDVPFHMTYNEYNQLIKYQYGNTTAINSPVEYDTEGNIIKNGARTFTYDDQDRIETITQAVNPTTTIVFNVAYSSQGLPEVIYTNRDDGSGVIETAITHLEYNSNNMPIVITEINESVAVSPYAKTTLTYNDLGNITQKFIERSNDALTFYDFSTDTYTYDNKKNPFALTISNTGISSKQVLQQFIGMNTLGFSSQVAHLRLYFNSPNNLLSIQDSFKTISYSYTYNDDDYPITREETYDATLSGGDVVTRNAIFTYETY